jgi:endonuclease/exonuclease/phosphatase family metal-dependent hydrolase
MTHVLRIGTWNLHEAVPAQRTREDVNEARVEITELLLRNRLDIVALQEVDFHETGPSPTLNAIKDSTPLKHVAYSVLSESAFYPEARSGVAIASRFPLKNVARRFLDNPDLTGEYEGAPIRMFNKGYVSAALTVAGSIISFVSLHAFPFHIFGRGAEESAFRPIWSSLSADLVRLAVVPLIVCGDFNTNKRDLVSSNGELAFSRAITYQPTYRNESLDDMLFTSQFELTGVKVVDNFSDHRFCLAEVTLDGIR